MIIQQALFGYSNGHHLLSSSTNIPAAMLKVLEPLSDFSGSDWQEGFLEYLTGYYFELEESLALSKTWYADEMNRPGCVWTHTLLIDFSDLNKISGSIDLSILFSRPSTTIDYSEYTRPIIIEPEPNFYNTILSRKDNEKIKKILSAVFKSPRPVLIGANSALEYESVFLLLWNNLGKGVVNGQSFCTGSLSNRIVNKKPLDFQVVPKSKVKNIIRTAPHGTILDDKKYEESEWINLLISNFISREDRTLVDFLNTMPSNNSNRLFVKSCAEILSAIQKNSEVCLSSIINLISPELESMGKKRIFSQTIIELLSVCGGVLNVHIPKIDIIEYLSTMSELELDLLTEDEIIRTIKQTFMEVESLPSESFTFLINNDINSFGEKIISYLSESAYKNGLERVVGSNLKGIDILVRLTPELAYSKKIWLSSKNIQLCVLDVLKTSILRNSDSFSRRLAYEIFETSTEEIIEGLYEAFGPKIVELFIDWSQTSFDSKRIKHWINICDYDLEYSIDRLPSNKNEIIAKSIIGLIDPYANLVKDVSSGYWVDFYRTNVANSDDDEYKVEFARFILPVILKSGNMYPEDLAFFAFNSIYLLLSKDRLDYNEWKRLSRLLPDIPWNNSWNRCRRLSKAAKKAGYNFKLNY